MFLVQAVIRRVAGEVGDDCHDSGQQDGGGGGGGHGGGTGPATKQFEGRWFGDENKKQIVRKPAPPSPSSTPCSPEATLIAGQSRIPGRWLAPNVFAAVWSSGSTQATVWVGVFDGSSAGEPRTAAIATPIPVAAAPSAGVKGGCGDILTDPETASWILNEALEHANYVEPWADGSYQPTATPTPTGNFTTFGNTSA